MGLPSLDMVFGPTTRSGHGLFIATTGAQARSWGMSLGRMSRVQPLARRIGILACVSRQNDSIGAPLLQVRIRGCPAIAIFPPDDPAICKKHIVLFRKQKHRAALKNKATANQSDDGPTGNRLCLMLFLIRQRTSFGP